QLTRTFQQHGPESMAITFITVQVLLNPALDASPVQRSGIVLHGFRVAQDRFESTRVLQIKLPQKQPRRLQNHTFHGSQARSGWVYSLLHSSALGSVGLSLCISCHSSRTFRSRASGTTILISTISSPRLPSLVAEGTPFSRRRSFCPLCVPGGTRSCERPSMVGTSIFAPSAASMAVTGTVA